MSQNNECGCGHPQLTMLPMHGFGLAVDASGLVPSPVPTPTGRERVDHDMHIYVNGNLAESGDGLSPETAVKSYEDAVLALSRYDGCNSYGAYFHFADLNDPDAIYPDMSVFTHNYATFLTLTVVGVSHETTKCGRILVAAGAYVFITNIYSTYLVSTGWMFIRGKIALKPRSPERIALHANWGGNLRLGKDAEVFLHPGKYVAAAYSICGVISGGDMSFHALGDIEVQQGFATALGNGCVRFTNTVNFSDCMTITGRKYYAIEQGSVIAGSTTLPGSLPGVTLNGGVYV